MKTLIEVLFEFTIHEKNQRLEYRGVKGADGSYRIEKRRLGSKKYRAVMWTGTIEGVERFRCHLEKLAV